LLKIYVCIQCRILTHIWHINISPLSIRLSVSVIFNQELPPLFHNVEPRYDITVGPSRGVNTDVNRHILGRATTKVVMIPHLNPKFEGLNIWVFRFLLFNLHFFIQCWVLIDTLYIYHNLFSLKYDAILTRAWHGCHTSINIIRIMFLTSTKTQQYSIANDYLIEWKIDKSWW